MLRLLPLVVTTAFASLVTLAPSVTGAHVNGTIEVDEITLPRLCSIADVLVKVDSDYPFGDGHDQFKELVQWFVDSAGSIRDDFIIATLGVNQYGDMENQAFAMALGSSGDKDKFPEYIFVPKGIKELGDATKYTGGDVKAESIAVFVRSIAGVRLGATGGLADMDGIAARFVAAGGDTEVQTALVEEATKVAKAYTSSGDKEIADVYLKAMNKSLQKGVTFFGTETTRVKKLLDEGTMSDAKKSVFHRKLKVLSSFTNPISDEL